MINLSNKAAIAQMADSDNSVGLSLVSSRAHDLNTDLQKMQNEFIKLELKFQGQHAFMNDLLKSLDDLDKCSDFNQLKSSIYRIKKRISSEVNVEERWESLDQHLDLVQSEFYQTLKTKYTSLTHVDLEMCAYLRMNMCTKDIARHLNLSIRGVETRKYRLKKKFSLGKTSDLAHFINTL